jgi:hypothetical protein
MPTCFVIMPITTPAHHVERYGGDGDHFLHVLEHLFTPALEEAGYEAISPVASGSDLIQAEIIRNLDEADLALCDMTTLNANVFFELGIRTALNRPVATVRDAFTTRIPFDNSMVNCFEYRWQMDTWVVKEEIPRLAAHIRACVERGGETNTLWKRLGIEATAQVGSAGTTTDDKLDFVIRQLEEMRPQRSVVMPGMAPPPPSSEPIAGSDDRLYVAAGVTLTGDLIRALREMALIVTEAGAAFSAYLGESGLVLVLGRFRIDADTLARLHVAATSRGFRMHGTSDDPSTHDEIVRLGLQHEGYLNLGKPIAWIG